MSFRMLLRHFAEKLSTSRYIDIYAQPSAFIYLAIMILLIPAKWLFAAFVAAIIHELGHIACLMIMNVRIYSISISCRGAVIHTEPMSELLELLSACAGPAAGIIFLVFYPIFPHVSFCAFLQSIFNLLPIYPFDGWRILCSALSVVRHILSRMHLLCLDK